MRYSLIPQQKLRQPGTDRQKDDVVEDKIEIDQFYLKDKGGSNDCKDYRFSQTSERK